MKNRRVTHSKRRIEPGSDARPSDSQRKCKLKNDYTKVKMMTLNARSLQHKLKELIELLYKEDIDIACITETRWKISENFEENGYIFMMGSSDKYKGGTAIIFKSKFKNYIDKVRFNSTRITSVNMKINKVKLKIISCYFPTSNSPIEELEDTYEKLRELLLSEVNNKPLTIIGGDFNAKIQYKRKIGNKLNGNTSENERGELLEQFCNETELSIGNTLFTKKKSRRKTWKSPDKSTTSEIDYFLIDTRSRNLIQDIRALQKHIFNSDHNPLIMKINLPFKQIKKNSAKKPEKPILEKIDTIKLSEARKKVNWDMIGSGDEKYEKIKNNLIYLTKASYTKKKNNTKRITEQPHIRNLLIKRMNLKEKGLNYTIISKLIRILIKEEEIKRNNIIIDRALKEGRSMKYVYKETRKRKFNDLKPEDIINWFEEISGKERGTNIDWKKEIKNHKEWTPITAKEVMDRIKKTKRKACGPDGIYTEHLIVGDYQLTKALSELYNQHGREIPKQMNECNVILLKKSKEKMDVRPIALLQCFFKIYTGVLLKRIDKEIEKQLDDSQGGFRAGRNTNQQILQFREIVSTCYEYKKDIYAIFIDFRKAFDSVNHTWITYSLAVAGIDEETIMRIQALYKNPKATFKTGVNEKSTTLTLKSGIRQGDTLSPKLFILLLQVVMNKVKKELEILNEDEKRNLVQLVKEGKTTESFKLEFADDIVIYTYDQKLTEKIAKFIEIHAGIVGLQINKKKTKMMGTEFKKKIEDPVYEVVDRYKYLGRTLTMDLRDDSLDFNERAKGAWRARYKANDLLRRTKDIRIKKKIYNMIIRPVFLYSIEAIRPTKSIILKYVNLEKKITQSIFRKEITLEKNVEDIIKERINKAQKPYRILLDETWKRKPGRPPKKILEMNSMHNEKKLRTQPQRKAKNKTNYTED